MSTTRAYEKLSVHRDALVRCRRCATVTPPVVACAPVISEIYLVGQAPGPREGKIGRPFAYTAGRTLFAWLATLGVDEEKFRARVYMAAVLRCFPGKAAAGGGDRVPSREEIATCRAWMQAEMDLIRPKLVIAVGRLAIAQLLGHPPDKLAGVVGDVRHARFLGHDVDWIALPHPSGLSAWHKTEPGKSLLSRALVALGSHPSWSRTFGELGRVDTS